MMHRRLRSLAIIALALVASCREAPGPAASDPAAFKARFAVEPVEGAGVQRLYLPAQALIEIQRADMGDLRLFDGRGRQVSLARGTAETSPSAESGSLSLMAIPIVAGAGKPGGGMTIALDERGGERTVTIATGDGAGPASAGALLDTRAIADPVTAITLDAALPPGQPVTFTLAQSSDLAQWQPLAEKVLFSAGLGGQLLGSGRIALGGADLHGRYVRVSWDNLPGVALRGASLATSRIAPPPRVSVIGKGLTLESERLLRFAVPFATPLAAIRLTETGPDGTVPVRVYGRNRPEEPWSLVAAGIVRAGTNGSLIDLPGPSLRDYRVEADERSAGFASALKLELQFDPVELVAAFNGAPPYVLAVGAKTAEPAYFSVHEIAPADLLAKGPLPVARVGAVGVAAPQIAVEPASEGALDWRRFVLWAALLLGTAVLAFAAIRLLRANAAPARDQAES